MILFQQSWTKALCFVVVCLCWCRLWSFFVCTPFFTTDNQKITYHFLSARYFCLECYSFSCVTKCRKNILYFIPNIDNYVTLGKNKTKQKKCWLQFYLVLVDYKWPTFWCWLSFGSYAIQLGVKLPSLNHSMYPAALLCWHKSTYNVYVQHWEHKPVSDAKT